MKAVSLDPLHNKFGALSVQCASAEQRGAPLLTDARLILVLNVGFTLFVVCTWMYIFCMLFIFLPNSFCIITSFQGHMHNKNNYLKIV